MSNPVVLDEDTYTEAISLIIERDFFPNLAKMKAQQNYLEAQVTGSLIDLQQAGKTLHDLSQQSPSKGNKVNIEEGVNYYKEIEQDISKRVNVNLSLDQFQTLYTSEDNASFTDLLEKANIKVKEQNKWFFARESLRIEGSSQKYIEGNSLAPSGTKYKARNSLMYYPTGKSESWVNDEARGAPKAINHSNTHLVTTTEAKQVNKLAPSDREASKGNITPWHQLNNGSNTPGINGYSLVEATPALDSNRSGTPQMTWGSIEGTPLLISGNETPAAGPRFSLPQVSKREELGMKLSEKASKAYRKKTTTRVNTPGKGAGLMSPAAQHLFRKSTPLRTNTGFGDALRSSYRKNTPTPIPLFRAGGSTTPAMIVKKKK